jgi:hypothetical protein
MRRERRGWARGLSRLGANAAALTAVALTGALAVTAGPAYADVTSSDYTIGTPSPPVSSVVASPETAAADAATNFEVSFTPGTSLAGGAEDWVSIAPSEPLGSTPTGVALIGSSCVQAGTNGGAFSATGLTIDLASSCSIGAGTKAEVDFTADAPIDTGTLTFTVTTSENVTPASSNAIAVATPGPTLSAMSYAYGANTTYTIGKLPVAGLTANSSSLTLTAAATQGTGTITFVDSPTGTGYTATYTPPGGAATSDTVEEASATGATVTLKLATPLASGDTVDITASGLNPASSGSGEADDIAVQPGNGTVETTDSIVFGGSVTAVSVTPAFLVATASTTYTVDFHASNAVPMGGYIYLTEAAGPTDFASTTSIEVTDATQNWHFTATGAVLSNGSATIPLQDAITAGDLLSISIANVTNPPAGGAISDFTVATSGDPVASAAPPYLIEANASPGVVVTVDPSSAGAVATYTMSSIFAAAAITGGSGTVKLEAPAGTVFPNNPSFYSIADQTNASGSGTVSDPLSGGGTNVVTFTVPNDIGSGDALTLTVSDVRNPSTSSPTDSITLVGNVTGPPPVAPPPAAPKPNPAPIAVAPAPTSTTTKSTTPVTTPAPAATGTVSLAGTSVTVEGGIGTVKLTCTGTATCSGKLTLTAKIATKAHNKKQKRSEAQRIETQTIGTASFSVATGKTVTVRIELNTTGRRLLSSDHGHLKARLGIAKSSPSPREAQTKTVTLSESKPTKKQADRQPQITPQSAVRTRWSARQGGLGRRANSAASIIPVGPPPTITTACSVIATLPSDTSRTTHALRDSHLRRFWSVGSGLGRRLYSTTRSFMKAPCVV